MTLRQSETVLRALVALALGFGFVGFATHSHPGRAVTAAVSSATDTADVEAAATPIVDVGPHAGI